MMDHRSPVFSPAIVMIKVRLRATEVPQGGIDTPVARPEIAFARRPPTLTAYLGSILSPFDRLLTRAKRYKKTTNLSIRGSRLYLPTVYDCKLCDITRINHTTRHLTTNLLLVYSQIRLMSSIAYLSDFSMLFELLVSVFLFVSPKSLEIRDSEMRHYIFIGFALGEHTANSKSSIYSNWSTHNRSCLCLHNSNRIRHNILPYLIFGKEG